MADNVLKARIVADTSGFNNNVEKASGSIEELRQVSKSLKAEIVGLDASMRNSKGGKVLQSELRVVTSELKKLEQQSAITGQNAGNSLTKGFSGLRQIAYLLPGIGIAGIFNVIFDGIGKLVDSLGSLGGAVTPLQDMQAAIEGASKEFVKASANVSELKTEIDLAKKGFIDKDAVVKHYNETIGKTTGLVTSLDEAERALNKNADAYIRFTLLKAAANIALEKAAQKTFDAQVQNQKDLERISKITTGAKDQEGIGEFIKSGEENLRKQEQAAADKRVNSLKTIAEGFNNEAAQIAKTFGFNFFQDNKEAKKSTDTFEQEANKVISKAKELASFLNGISIRDIRFQVDPRDTLGETLKKARDFIAATKDITKNFKVKFNFFQAFDFKFIDDKLFKDLPKETEDLQKKVQKEIQDLTDRNPILLEFKKLSIKITGDRQKLESDLKDLQTGIKEAVGGAVEGIAATIGDALSGKNPLAGVLNVIGDLIQQIGRALIKFAIVRGILDKILKNPLIAPGIAFALGAAAIAIGQLVKNIKPSGARASGGGVNAGQGYYVGEQGKELFVPNTAGRIIPNNSLPGNTGRVQAAPVLVTGRLVASGNDLIAVLSSATRSQNRLS